MSAQIRFPKSSGLAIAAETDKTILEQSLKAGIDFPYSCQSGRCGACKSRLIEGEIEHLPHSRFTLTETEREAGIFLACRALPKGDVSVAWLEEEDDYPVNRAVYTVSAVEKLNHDVVRVVLRAPALGEPMRFKAGQFAIINFPGCEPRSYSMANLSGEAGLEFFIRRVPGGKASEYAWSQLRAQDKISLSGPFGTSYLRQTHTGPILIVAGGTGLAPALSIVREAARSKMRQRIDFHFGVRTEADLFGLEELKSVKATLPNLQIHFGPGRVGDRVLAKWPEFHGNWHAYLAGPPKLVESLIPELDARGIPPDQIFSDPFYFSNESEGISRPTA